MDTATATASVFINFISITKFYFLFLKFTSLLSLFLSAAYNTVTIHNVLAVTSTNSNSGFSSCTCIGDNTASHDHVNHYQLNDTTIMVPTAKGVYLYPKNYGAFCSEHDLGRLPYCENYTSSSENTGSLIESKSSDPYNCLDSWCYVDHKSCENAEFYPSEYFLGRYYSYHTCMKLELINSDSTSVSSSSVQSSTPSKSSSSDSLVTSNSNSISSESSQSQLLKTAANDFRKSITTDALRGKTLRYSYPKESIPWHYRDDKGRWTGLMHRFFEDLALRGEFKIEYVEPNSYSYSLMNTVNSNSLQNSMTVVKSYQVDNLWDACTHSVMMGYLDLCPTAVWETPNRRDMSLFAAAVLTSNFRLMVKQTLDEGMSWNPKLGYSSVWFSFLKPFSPGLWAALIGTSILAGICIWAAEKSSEKIADNGPNSKVMSHSKSPAAIDLSNSIKELDNDMNSDKHHSEIVSSVTNNGPFTFKHHKLHKNAMPKSLDSDSDSSDSLSLTASIYHSAFGLWITDVPHKVVSPGGKVLKLFYAALIMISINSYTANLASTLLMSHQKHTGIQSVHECYDGGNSDAKTPCRSVCVASQIVSELFASHPRLSANAQIFPSSSATFNAFVNGGVCDATVVPDHDVKARQDFQRDMRRHKLMLVGEPLFTMTVGTPVGENIAVAYSLLSLKYHYEGGFQRLWDVYTPKSILPNYENDLSKASTSSTDASLNSENESGGKDSSSFDGSGDDKLQLTTSHLMGLFLGFGICVIFAGTTSIWQLFLSNPGAPAKQLSGFFSSLSLKTTNSNSKVWSPVL